VPSEPEPQSEDHRIASSLDAEAILWEDLS